MNEGSYRLVPGQAIMRGLQHGGAASTISLICFIMADGDALELTVPCHVGLWIISHGLNSTIFGIMGCWKS